MFLMDYVHSFVVLAYKDSVYLEDCIRSLLAQTVKSEIFISTSTPSPFLKKIAEKYRLRLYPHSGKGIGPDWSKAYALAKTQYVTLAHQDDIYDSSYTECCLLAARQRSNSLIIFTKYSELRTDPKRGYFSLLIKQLLSGIFIWGGASQLWRKRALLVLGCPILCPSVMFHKARLGKFVFRDDMVVALDWEAWWRIAAMTGSFVYVDRDLVKHRIHSDMETVIRIEDSKRMVEDRYMFSLIWPSPIRQIVSWLYTFGYGANLH